MSIEPPSIEGVGGVHRKLQVSVTTTAAAAIGNERHFDSVAGTFCVVTDGDVVIVIIDDLIESRDFTIINLQISRSIVGIVQVCNKVALARSILIRTHLKPFLI